MTNRRVKVKKYMKVISTNRYLRNRNARFGIANFSYVKGMPYQIVDRKTGKHYYYSDIRKRNNAFKKLITSGKR